DRSGHTGARETQIVAGVSPEEREAIVVQRHLIGVAVVFVQIGAIYLKGDDAVTRRNDIGFEDEIYPRGSTAGVGGDPVVRMGSIHVFHGSNGDDIRIVAWRADAAIGDAIPLVVQ